MNLGNRENLIMPSNYCCNPIKTERRLIELILQVRGQDTDGNSIATTQVPV